MSDTAMLVIIEGPEVGTVFKLGRRSLTLGREKGNLIQLVQRGISRRHVMIKWTGDGYRLMDLQSTNGTLVNGQRITDQQLAVGDTIKIGDVTLQLAAELPGAVDATYSRSKEVAPALVGVKTNVVDSGVAPEPEPEPAAPEPETPPRPRVVDLEGLQQVDTSELEFALFRITTDEDYLQIVFGTLASYIAPDRAFVFLLTPQRKARKLASWANPALDQQAREAPVALELLAQTLYGGRPQLENALPTAGAPGQVATAAAVCLQRPRGALYLDSLLPHRKTFLSSDIKLLGDVATALGPRLA